MIRPFHLCCRTRRRLIWLVTLLLLWQQVALAGSVCSTPVPAAATRVVNAAMTRADGVMGAMPMHAHDPLCAEHCAQGASAQPDARAPNVPPSLLPALPLLSPVVHRFVGNVAFFAAGSLLLAQPPPPRLRFCSLLI
jgi:hypothetical protein